MKELTEKQIQQLADQYELLSESERLYRLNVESETKKLEDLVIASMEKNLYEDIYCIEYGNKHEFVNKIAAELRRRSAILKK